MKGTDAVAAIVVFVVEAAAFVAASSADVVDAFVAAQRRPEPSESLVVRVIASDCRKTRWVQRRHPHDRETVVLRETVDCRRDDAPPAVAAAAPARAAASAERKGSKTRSADGPFRERRRRKTLAGEWDVVRRNRLVETSSETAWRRRGRACDGQERRVEDDPFGAVAEHLASMGSEALLDA